MQLTRRATLTAAVVALLGVGTLQANAAGTTEVTAASPAAATQQTVSVSDLNLESAQGQEVLMYRISKAAREVCGSANVRRAGSVALAARNHECYEQSLSRAMAEVSRGSVVTLN